MKNINMSSMVDEFEKISAVSDSELDIINDRIRSVLPFSKNDYHDALGAVVNRENFARQAEGISAVNAAISQKNPDFQYLKKELSKMLKVNAEAKTFSRIHYTKGAADALDAALNKAVSKELPKTVATIGGLIAGSLLLNHAVKKYRESETSNKKGRR